MSTRIEIPNKLTWRERGRLIIEIVSGINPLLNISGAYTRGAKTVSISYSTESVVITVPDPQNKIDSLQAQINALESRVATLESA